MRNEGKIKEKKGLRGFEDCKLIFFFNIWGKNNFTPQTLTWITHRTKAEIGIVTNKLETILIVLD